MYRVWYSTESFADFIIDHTILKSHYPEKNLLFESDANKPRKFFTMPDHIRKILYLDAPDLIVEKNGEPIFTIEVTSEAGTGHNAFQRFSRIAASVENGVPAIYIYPEAKVIYRKKNTVRTWDEINPLVFFALEKVMRIYGIPALLYYFPSNYQGKRQVDASIKKGKNGLIYDSQHIKYPGCPDSNSNEMQDMFNAINCIIKETEKTSVLDSRSNLVNKRPISNRISWMSREYTHKLDQLEKPSSGMSPSSATVLIPTEILLNYLKRYETKSYHVGSLLRGRENTLLYQVDAKFRGDPYPGALAALDYISCREGKTYEDRDTNLALVWGRVDNDSLNAGKLNIVTNKEVSVEDFCTKVGSSMEKSLLGRPYSALHGDEIPRYYMQVRYGSTYSKAKHIRVYSHFADAILFPDGALWKDA